MQPAVCLQTSFECIALHIRLFSRLLLVHHCQMLCDADEHPAATRMLFSVNACAVWATLNSINPSGNAMRHLVHVNSVFGCNCRNRQVTAFYDVVEYFRPAYVLMENVLDILKKEDGTYAKSAMASLLTMRYQVRIGVIAACDQGVPQSRNRCAPACLLPSQYYCCCLMMLPNA